jgi:hypothetical protein
MSVETTLKSLINPLVAGGCHNGVNDAQPIVVPYVVFHEIAGTPTNGLSVEYLGLTKFRFQIDIFARTPEQAKGIAIGTIRTAIAGSAILKGIMIFQMKGQYSELDKTHQYITEYEIWAA